MSQDFQPNDLVVVDTETTGLDPASGHEIIEIAAQKVRNKVVIQEFVRLIRPSRLVPAEAQAIHGISNEELAQNGLAAKDVLGEFREFAGPSVIVGHNVGFDLGFINHGLDKHGHPVLTNNSLDTLEIARRYLILASYRLSNVAAYLKVPQPSAHRALVDVITCREVFFKLIERAQQK